MNKIKYLWSEFISREIAIGFSFLLVFTLISQFLGFIPSYLIGQLLNGFQAGKDFNFVLIIIGIFLASRILKTVNEFIKEKYDLNKVTFKFIEDFHEISLKKMMNRPLSFFMVGNTSKQIREIEKGFRGLRNLVFQSFFWFIPTFLTLVLSCVFLLVLYPVFGVIATITAILYFFSIKKYWDVGNKKLQKWSEKESSRFGLYSGLIQNTIEIKIANADDIHEHYLKKLRGLHKYGKKMWWILFIIETISYNIGEICMLFALGLGGYMVVNQQLMIGDFSIIYMWLARVIGNMSNVSNMMRNSVSNAASVSNLISLLRKEEGVLTGSKKVWFTRSEILFDEVSFSYNGKDGHAIKNLSFSIKPGQFVSFVGPSGAGKSTIFKLLLQGIKPRSGRILVDGIDLNEIDSKVLISQIAYIPQEKLLFDISLRANVLLGISRNDISDQRIAEIFESLGLSHLMDRLHLPIGENGKKLSGGERQRILFARVMLKDQATLVLMDEPTSDLDSESETQVRKAVRTLCESGKTVIMIAHRLTIVQDSDVVHVLKEGKIVSSGNHRKLLDFCENYRRMVRNQTVSA